MAEKRLEEIRRQRLERRQALIAAGNVPYPSEVRRTHTLSQILDSFSELQQGKTPILLLGRITSLRKHGALVFIDLVDQSGALQLQISQDSTDKQVFERLQYLDSGDWIQASGTCITTKRGQQTLKVTEFHIVSKSLRPLPDEWYGLKDHEQRYREREVDLLLNKSSQNVFLTRSKIIQWIRSYLNNAGFLEVETPILQPIAGGAAAKPFTTHHNALDIDLFLRIAPELYLKRLLVGGMEKVYEIGRNFRNEGISREHNPEFTMLEFYWAHTDYEDLMSFAEDMLSSLTRDMFSTTDFTWQGADISFDTPFARKRYIDIVSDTIGLDIMKEKEPSSYEHIFKKHNLPQPTLQTYTKYVDELYKELVRPTLVQPTIVYDYPVEMVPLAKQSSANPAIAEKFQLLVAGTELVNAYTECNDPVVQRERFLAQQQEREAGNEEAQVLDESYLRAMEYGMPPVSGFGLGVDRLTMILSDVPSIRDTILFPLLRPKEKRNEVIKKLRN